MLYKEYQGKIEKIAKIVDNIKKHRVLILSIIGAILAMFIAFLSVRGIIVDDLVISTPRIVYGQKIDCDADVLFGNVGYEYRLEDGSDWKDGLPTEAGSYSIRAYSTRTFGIKNYTDEQPFVIDKKAITVTVSKDSLFYGEYPTPDDAVLENGDRFRVAEFEYERKTGSVEMVAEKESIKIVNKSGVDVTSSYDISVEEKEVTVNPKTLKITVKGEEKEYDGEPLTFSDTSQDELIEQGKVTVSELAYNDKIELKFSDTIENVGNIRNTPEYKILNADGDDVTEYYIVNISSEDLSIKQRPVTFTVKSVNKEYDGKEHTCTEIENDYELLKGHRVEFKIEGSQTDKGETTAALNNVVIYNGSNEDVTENYAITKVDGTVTITPREITVTANGYKIYDGKEFAIDNDNNDAEFESINGLVDGHVICLQSDGVNVDTYDEDKIICTIKDKTDTDVRDVTDNYTITISETALEIAKRTLKIQAASATKIYDTQELSDPGHKIVEGELPDGHELAVEVTGSITNVGTEANVIKLNWIYRNDGGENKDATDNFIVTPYNGTLEVTPRKVEVTASVEKTYDGTNCIDVTDDITLTVKKIENNGFRSEGLYGEQIFKVTKFNLSGDYVNAGKYSDAVKIEKYEIIDGNVDNYEVTCFDGDIIIDQREIKVYTPSGNKIYNGTEQTLTMFESSGVSDFSAGWIDNLVDGHSVEFSNWTKQTDYTQGKSYDNIATIKILGKNNEDVTENYTCSFVWGKFGILKREVSLKLSDEKVYDGRVFDVENIENPEYVENSLELVDGHVINLCSNESYAKVYTGSNVNWEITVGNIDVTNNYDLKLDSVELTINKRQLKVLISDHTKTYDAEKYSVNDLSYYNGLTEYSVNNLIDGHRFVCSIESDLINAGNGEIYLKENTWAVVYGAEDLSNNYTVNYESGTLTVKPCPIEVSASLTKTYDDTSSVNMDDVVFSVIRSVENVDGLFGEQKFSAECEINGNYVDVDIVDDGISIIQSTGQIINGDISNYDITYMDGILIINPRKITVKSADAKKAYDGTDLSNDTLRIEKGSLAIGHNIAIITVPSIKQVDKIYNTIEFAIKKGDVDKTGNYTIKEVYGELEITNRSLVIGIYDYKTTYDGKSHDFADKGYWIAGGDGLLAGDSLISLTDYVLRNEEGNVIHGVGEQVTNVCSYNITATPNISYGGTYTNYYEVSFVYGSFIIEHATLKIMSNNIVSTEKITKDDTKGKYYYTGNLYEEDKLEVVVLGEQLDKGESINRIERIFINDETIYIPSDGQYVCGNYKITVIQGMLTYN